MNREKFNELVPLYAIGALDGAELRDFENYLRTASAAEHREVRELTDIAAWLPLALPSEPVPVQAKTRLFARLESEPVPETAAVSRQLIQSPEKPRFSFLDFFNWRPATALLSFATLLLALTSGWLWWENRLLLRERHLLTAQLNEKDQAATDAQHRIDELASQTTRLISLAGKEAPQANAKVFWDTTRNQWVIYVFNLPVAPAGKVYQLWYITKDQQKLAAETFRPDARGRGELHVSVPSSTVPQLSATAITLEPAGGSVQPTGQIYLVGAVGA